MEMKNKIVKIIGWIFIGILMFFSLVIGWVFIQTKINPSKVPTIFGYKPFIVLSGSMETEIYKGDLAVVKVVDPASLKVNDIIAFKDSEGYVVTHRIVKVEPVDSKYRFITKGDNNNTNDSGYVEEEQIEGIYKFKMSGFGTVVLTMQRPTTLVFVLLIIFLGGFGIIAFDNSKMTAADKKELEEFRKKQAKSK